MGRVKTTAISETAEELLQLSKKVKQPLGQARLRAFYLYRTGQVRDFTQIGQQVGYERHAVGNWFRLYRQQGLSACLEINPGGNPTGSIICGKALEELKEKLSDEQNYFTSYTQIHQWLIEQHDIRLSYEHVHRFVHTTLGAKLKVVRKSNLKKDPVQEEAFKKK